MDYNLAPPPRWNKEFVSHTWQEWIHKLWDKQRTRTVQITGNPSRGSSAPTQVYYNSGNINVTGWKMKVGDELYFTFALPTEWIPGTPITFEMHYYTTNTAAAKSVAGTLKWSVVSAGEQISAATRTGSIASGNFALSTTPMILLEAPFTITSSGAKAGDHVFLYFIRTTTGADPASPADDPVFVHIEAQFQIYQNRS